VDGKLHSILSDCAARLGIPLTADSHFLGNSFLERTQLLLIWDLGEREGRGGGWVGIRYDRIRYDTMGNDTIRYDTMGWDTIRYDTMGYDRIRYDTIRYDTIR
jgi:hypothetical protein